MLRYSLLFLVFALVAGLLGFWALEGLAMWVAKVLFLVFIVAFVISYLVRGRSPPA